VQILLVNSAEGIEILTILIAKIEMVYASFLKSSCYVTRCTLIAEIDRELWFVFATYVLVELDQPFRFMGAIGAGDLFSFKRSLSNDIMRSQLLSVGFIAEKDNVTTLRPVFDTNIGPIKVQVASELIIAVCAAAAAKM